MTTKFRDLAVSILYGKGCVCSVNKFSSLPIVFKVNAVNGIRSGAF
jgi:hypothetical protein